MKGIGLLTVPIVDAEKHGCIGSRATQTEKSRVTRFDLHAEPSRGFSVESTLRTGLPIPSSSLLAQSIVLLLVEYQVIVLHATELLIPNHNSEINTNVLIERGGGHEQVLSDNEAASFACLSIGDLNVFGIPAEIER